MSVNRPGGHYVEVMDEEATMSYGSGTWKGLTVDSGVVYSGAATNTITGLAHLNGLVATVVANGVDRGGFAVSGGQVVVTGTPFTNAFAGLVFAATGETLPPDMPGQGTILRSKKHYVEIMAMVHQTLGMTIQGKTLSIPTAAPVTANRFMGTLGWNRDGSITFTQSQPYPATLLGLVGYLDLEQERDA
jgi:hypothetical protein